MPEYQGNARDRAHESADTRERNQKSLDHEKLEVLDGSRSWGKDVTRRAAVRIADLDGVLKMKHKVQSVTIAAAPTMAQYNTLLADVQRLNQALVDVSNALATRLAPTK